MNSYIIEHEIITLLKNYKDNLQPWVGSFSADWIKFTHWDFNNWQWLIWHKWITRFEIDSENYVTAINTYYKKLSKIIPKISLIWQAYIDSQRWSLLVKKWNQGFLRYIYNGNPVSLKFWKEEKNILTNLVENKNIPESFYLYWNELLNTSWYLAKILIMWAAMDSLFPKKERMNWRIKILWEKLAKELYENWNIWLRHRLTHWEYFSPEDFQKNYVEEVHKKVIEYFNTEVITIDDKISQGIVNPQRHLYSNYKQSWLFLEFDRDISLKEILPEIQNNELSTLKSWKCIRKPENF